MVWLERMKIPWCEAAILFYESFKINCLRKPQGGGGAGGHLHFSVPWSSLNALEVDHPQKHTIGDWV